MKRQTSTGRWTTVPFTDAVETCRTPTSPRLSPADDILWWSSGQWQAVGTVVLVLVTLTYVIYTARLSEHAKRSATSAEKAASAAEHSASSAERAAETAERGLLLQVMPLVFGHEARVTGGGRSDVTLFGVGRFPAFTLQGDRPPKRP